MPAKSKSRTKPKPESKTKQKPISGGDTSIEAKKKQKKLSADSVMESIKENSPLDVPVDDFIEPDETLLVDQEEDLEEVVALHVRETTDLAEDPVRLYLREIGQVKLLGADSEFRLATIIEADRLVATLGKLKQRKGTTLVASIYHALIADMLTSWDRLVEDAERLDHELPDLALLVAEAQSLHSGWEFDSPSYLRAYLDNGQWGSNHLWDNLARHAYSGLSQPVPASV
jgi:RNA polymerase primary sigma factor